MRRSICDRVRDSCTRWMVDGNGPKYVRIHSDALLAVAQRIQQQAKQVVWDEEDWHYQPPLSWPDHVRNERISLYILALDAINFCFWPSTDNYEYVDLACTLTSMATSDHAQLETILDGTNTYDKGEKRPDTKYITSSYLLSADRLRNLSVDEMQRLFTQHHKDQKYPPDMDKRCALWNELGRVLCDSYQGSALALVESAGGSAVKLVQRLYDEFPGFRDVAHVVQEPPLSDTTTQKDTDSTPTCFFLKRAQICVGDLQAALSVKFTDTDQLTTFADYRLPQLLRHWNVMEYVDSELEQAVDARQQLPVGSEAEVSIRAATVVVVEQLVDRLREMTKSSISTTGGLPSGTEGQSTNDENPMHWNAVQVDWYLWQVGERMDGSGELKPHHRVRTIYY